MESVGQLLVLLLSLVQLQLLVAKLLQLLLGLLLHA
jgi:hypothetical protein